MTLRVKFVVTILVAVFGFVLIGYLQEINEGFGFLIFILGPILAALALSIRYEYNEKYGNKSNENMDG